MNTDFDTKSAPSILSSAVVNLSWPPKLHQVLPQKQRLWLPKYNRLAPFHGSAVETGVKETSWEL